MKCAKIFIYLIFFNLFLHDAKESALETRQMDGGCQGWNDDCSNNTFIFFSFWFLWHSLKKVGHECSDHNLIWNLVLESFSS